MPGVFPPPPPCSSRAEKTLFSVRIARELLIVIEKYTSRRAGRPVLIIYFENVTSNRSEKLNTVCSASDFARYPLPHFISFHFAYSNHFLTEYFL